MNLRGLGTPQDAHRAKEGFDVVLRMADQGASMAQECAGEMFEEGNGVSRNYAIAAQWYQKAADQG